MKQYKIVVICMCILLLLAGGVYAQQKTVRILAIGNSFSQDAVEQYLHELAEAEGISTIIGNMFIGGCSLERHVKNARDNAPAYAYRKIGTDGKKQNDSYCIWNDKEDIAVGLTLEQTLDFEFDGVKLRDFITTDDVEITERIM